MKKSAILKLLIVVIFVLIGYWTVSRQAEAPVQDNSQNYITPNIEEVVAKIFADEYAKDLSDVTIQLHNQNDNYLRGTVIFEPGGSENTSLFLASRLGNSWDIIFSDNGAPDCSVIIAYNFPREFLIGICDQIFLNQPLPSQIITNPLHVAGEARGTWFFEGSFPVIMTDWDGKIIAEGLVMAQSDWMTEDLVPFIADIEFNSPVTSEDQEFMKYGLLILQKANPSGLLEHDDALEMPIRFVE